jgi:ATP-dependent DNA helicase RecQ
MAQRRPETLQQLAGISGVGERKLAAYGDAFLDCLHAHAGRTSERPESNT